ncbi:sulfurtransferase complex subunit TusD [Methylomagnum sp.]
MRYAIQINTGPGQSQSAHTAYQFIHAALAAGHEVIRVFFYHEGVHHGFGEGSDWSGLARQHGVDLVLCVSAAERRGLSPTSANPAEGFRVGGLGQWMDACLKADRVMVFGG